MEQALIREARALNTLGDYLAARDIPALTREALMAHTGAPQVDLLILFGGSIPYGCELAAQAYRAGMARRMAIVGGEGHTTPFLRAHLKRRMPSLEVEGRMESDVIAGYLGAQFGLRREELLLEDRSTNCGENVHFALEMVKRAGLRPESLLILQDSSMQRRMDATFRRVWTQWPVKLINYAAYRAHVVAQEGGLAFAPPVPWGMWSMERYITLLMGEIPRLRDAPEGYGPRGRDFIAHVDVPQEVLDAFELLKERHGDQVRPPWARENA